MSGNLEAIVAGLDRAVGALERMVEKLEERLTQHEQNCIEAYRDAKKDRHDFRAEMALTLGEVRKEASDGRAALRKTIDDLGLKLDIFHGQNTAATSRLHSRINYGIVGLIGVLLSVIGGMAILLIQAWGLGKIGLP